MDILITGKYIGIGIWSPPKFASPKGNLLTARLLGSDQSDLVPVLPPDWLCFQ
jgi:hypothetical protein